MAAARAQGKIPRASVTPVTSMSRWMLVRRSTSPPQGCATRRHGVVDQEISIELLKDPASLQYRPFSP
jgi:hypothetical protein